MNLLVTGTDGLILPVPAFDAGMAQLLGTLRIYELIVPGTTSISNCAYGWASQSRPRVFTIEPNPQRAAERADLAIFLWDGKDEHTQQFRAWTHHLNKQYRDWVVCPARDYRHL